MTYYMLYMQNSHIFLKITSEKKGIVLYFVNLFSVQLNRKAKKLVWLKYINKIIISIWEKQRSILFAFQVIGDSLLDCYTKGW